MSLFNDENGVLYIYIYMLLYFLPRSNDQVCVTNGYNYGNNSKNVRYVGVLSVLADISQFLKTVTFI